MLAPTLPFLADAMYTNLVSSVDDTAPDSVHLTRFPTAELATDRDLDLEASMDVARRAVDLARTLRSANRLKTRQPLARAWVAAPGGDGALSKDLLDIVASEINVKEVEPISDGSDWWIVGSRCCFPRSASGSGGHPGGHGRRPRGVRDVPRRWVGDTGR